MPVANAVVRQLVERHAAIQTGHATAPRRRRGRGSQLKSSDVLLVMFWALVVTDRPREIASALGYDYRTVARVLGSKRYAQVGRYVAERVIAKTVVRFRTDAGLRAFAKWSRRRRR